MSKRGVIIIVATGLLSLSLSFGLGYLLAKEENPAPIVIQKCPSP